MVSFVVLCFVLLSFNIFEKFVKNRDNRIDFGLLLKESIRVGIPIPAISSSDIGVFSVVGRRPYNEDFVSCHELTSELLYFAIFDGHGGDACARFVQENLPKTILQLLSQESSLEAVLQQSFHDINSLFEKSFTSEQSQNSETSGGKSSGTTATVCLLKNGVELVVAYVGDSRAFLCRDGNVKRLTNDHSASLKPEQVKYLNSN